MPGSIQVSVLDFKELPSSSNYVKVSLGKVEYEAVEERTFSFPLTKLRDNLIITVHDSEGNQVSHSAIRTMSIIEKGTWDDVFPIEGGGLIHMKLQFILSDEERNRIRLMRESAMKKKQDEILGSRLRNAESAQSPALPWCSREVSDVLRTKSSQEFLRSSFNSDAAEDGFSTSFDDTSAKAKNATDRKDATSTSPMTEMIVQKPLVEDTVSRASQTDLPNKNEGAKPNSSGNRAEKLHERNLKEKILSESICPSLQETKVTSNENNEIQSQLADVPSKRLQHTSFRDVGSSRSTIAEKIKSFSPKLTGELDKQGSTERTPRNIKKMISVFESSISQDREPLKPLSTKSYRIGTLRSLKDSPIKDYYEKSESSLKNSEALSSTRLRTSFSTGDLRKNLSSIITKIEQTSLKSYSVEPSETSLQSNENDPRGTEKLPKDSVADTNMSVNNKKIVCKGTNPKNVLKSSEEDATISGRRLPNDMRNTEMNSVHGRQTSKENPESFDHDGSGPRIVLDEKRHFCMTAKSDGAMRLLSDSKIEENGHREKIVALIPEIDVNGKVHGGSDGIVEQGEETVHVSGNITPKCEDEDASNGSLGQVIKIALVVGFGVLVLLFRQREDGNAKKKENTHASKNKVFMRKRGSIEERRLKIDVIKLS